MSWARAGKVSRPSLAVQMAAIPVRNQRLRISQEDACEIIVVELKRPLWLRLLQPLLRMPKERRYRLEGIGLEVWRAVDGVRSIGSLAEDFASRHRLSYHEARALLLSYLRTLVGKGLLVIVGVLVQPEDEMLLKV